MVDANTIKTGDLAKVQSIDFTNRFAGSLKKLQELLGITRLQPMASGMTVYDLIHKLTEAMTQEIVLPEGCELLLQTDQGLQDLLTEETGEKHAVLAYDFRVCYGFKCKI